MNELEKMLMELNRKKSMLGKGIDHLITGRIEWLEKQIDTLKLFK